MMDDNKSTNVTWHAGKVSRQEKSQLLTGPNKVLWFTGLSGSGKSTVARELEKTLHNKGLHCYVLDGDNVRHGLNGDLNFSVEDRKENLRRIREVTKLFHDAGTIVLVSFISPYHEVRDKARDLIGEDFIEIFVDASLEECEKRDTKGLYKKARAGEIKEFTGISAVYEQPLNPEIILKTDQHDVDTCVNQILEYLNL